MSIFKRIRGYCPHPPLRNPRLYPLVYKTSWFSLQVRDFESSLDALVGFAILYGILFLASLIALPQVGVTEEYQLALARAGSAILLSLALTHLYARFRGIRFLSSENHGVMRSVLESFFVVAVWGGLWFFLGALSNAYDMKLDSSRFAAAPLSLILGLLSSLIVYGYCAPKFQLGVGRLLGIVLASSIGALLFLVASIDYPLSFLPLIVLLVYVGLRTHSAVGPIIFTTILFGLFYVWSVAPPLMGSLQPTFGSIAAAILSGLFLFGIGRLQLREGAVGC